MIHVRNVTLNKPAFLGSGNWVIDGLNEVTVLFGKNGSGKSLLLRTWRNTNHERIHYVIPERIGTLNYEPQYASEEQNPDRRRDQSNQNYIDSYRQRIISRIQSYFVIRGAAKSTTLPGNPEDLEQLMKSLVPDFSVSLVGRTPPYVIKRIVDEGQISNVNQLSSGESQLLTVALDLLTISAIWDIEQTDQRIILMDEPDAHLHPDLQVRLAEFIFKVIEKFSIQIVVSTHSTTLLSALGQYGGPHTSVVYLLKTSTNLNAQPFTANLKELTACLGGHILMGPLFGAPLLIVEGDDDFKIWSQVPRHGIINLAVIPSNGDEIKQYQKLMEKLLGSICEPKIFGHALIDGDKGLPEPNTDNKQEYIRYLQLNCHEAENLFLTDEILNALGTSWPAAQIKLEQEAGNYGNKETEIRALDKADRRTVDLKNIINEVSLILDPKKVHWTTRVGIQLGKRKPVGQLADFLGIQVVKALW